MPSYVERTREVVSAESDDFFGSDTILYYLNKTQQKIVSYLIQIEQNSNKSLRALDSLRQYKDISTNALTFSNQGNYYSAEVEFPASPDEINQFVFLKYADTTVMRELSQNNRIKLEWGNLSPTDYESYYMVNKNDSDNIVFEIFVGQDDAGEGKSLRIYSILNPTEIALADETLAELPDRLENALIYGAAKMMVSQESINDEISQRAVQLFQQQHNEELQSNTY